MQALIQSFRWADASRACAQLSPGCDYLYLRSELLWRQGELPAAIQDLDAALSSNPASTKCSKLLPFLQIILEALQAASSAMDTGKLSVVYREQRGPHCDTAKGRIFSRTGNGRLLPHAQLFASAPCCIPTWVL